MFQKYADWKFVDVETPAIQSIEFDKWRGFKCVLVIYGVDIQSTTVRFEIIIYDNNKISFTYNKPGGGKQFHKLIDDVDEFLDEYFKWKLEKS